MMGRGEPTKAGAADRIMERILFSIDCTTCRARLAVRNEAAIGAILECPKCGSFVEIVPPKGWAPPQSPQPRQTDRASSAEQAGESPAELSAKSASAQDNPSAVPKPGASSGRPRPPAPQPTDSSAPRAAPRSAPSATVDLVEPPPGPPPLPAAAGAVPPPLPGSVAPELSPAAAMSAAERAWRRWIGWTAVVAGAAVVLAAAWSIWAARGPDGSQTTGTPQLADGASVDPVATPHSPDAPADAPGAAGGATSPTTPRPSQPPDGPAVKPPDASAEKPSKRPSSQPPQPPAASGSTESGGNEHSLEQPGPAPVTQPTDPPKDAESPAAMPHEAPAGVASTELPTPPPLPDEPPVEVPPATSDPPPAPAAREAVISTADEWAAGLARTVPAVQFDETPWVEAISLLAALGSVPVTIDADVLAPLEVDLHEPVSLRLESPTLLEALDRVADQAKLRAKLVEGQVLVTAPDGFRGELQRARYSVADLAADSAAMAELALMIERLVAPERWRKAGGEGSITAADGALEIVQTPDVQYEVLVFCEKLRLARGRPLRSRLDPARFALETRGSRFAAALDRPMTANFQSGAPLAEVLGYLAGAAEVDILVDRLGLSAAGVTDGKVVVLSVDQEPLRGALEKLLAPLGLAHRAVDGDVLQVTSRARVEARLELEFHPIGPRPPGELAPETLIEQLKSRLPAARWAEGDAPGGRVVFDAPSRCLLVLQSQPVQAAIERILSQSAQRASPEAP